MLTKVCTRCKKRKPLEAFKDQSHLPQRRKGARSSQCTPCLNEYKRITSRGMEPLYYYKKNLKACYNMSLDDYHKIQSEQQNKCAICRLPGKPRKGTRLPEYTLVVDHNHRTGTVRGLLCDKCNRNLGGLDNPEWLEKAEAYLAKYVDT